MSPTTNSDDFSVSDLPPIEEPAWMASSPPPAAPCPTVAPAAAVHQATTSVPAQGYAALASGAVHDAATCLPDLDYDDLIRDTARTGGDDVPAQTALPGELERPQAARPVSPRSAAFDGDLDVLDDLLPPLPPLPATPAPIPAPLSPWAAAASASFSGDSDAFADAPPPPPRRRPPPSPPVTAPSNSTPAPPARMETPPPPPGYISAQKHKRPLPKRVKVALVIVGSMAALLFVGSRCSQEPQTRAVVSAADETESLPQSNSLRQRKEVTASDYEVSKPLQEKRRIRPRASQSDAPSDSDYATPEQRRAARDRDREDVAAARRTAASTAHRWQTSTPAPTINEAPARRDLLDSYVPAPPEGSRAERSQRRAMLVPAATTVAARIGTELRMQGASQARVVALVDRGQALPAGTKLVGRARASNDGEVTIVFSTLVFADGRDVRVRAEAHHPSGGPLIGFGGEPGTAVNAEGSVARDVAANTGRRALSTALGAGLLGSAADDALTARDRQRGSDALLRPSAASVVTLPRDAAIQIFFVDRVDVD